MNLDLFDSPSGSPKEGEEEGEDGRDAGRPVAQKEEPRVWSVSEINRAVRTLLEDALPPLWIRGEVANWTRARSGHRYFTLKDEGAQIDCVLWRRDADRLPTDPDEGTSVRVYGTLGLYEARGRYQLVAREVEGEGAEGLWRIAFEKLRAKLQEEGLTAPERKRPVPRFPQRVGVVTSTTGAALRDVLSVLRRRAPWVRVLVRSTRVQGEGSAAEVADALRVLGGSGRVDVVILTRGGGSLEDLWAFNEEPVARAIVECPVPVISGVGHEVDVTIADLVADLRAPTPSAAAEAAVPDASALLEGLRSVEPRLVRGLHGAVERRWQRIDEAHGRLARAVDRLISPRVEGVARARRRLERQIRALVERRRQWLARAAGKAEALSPLSVLRRGYAVPLGKEGGVLRGVAEFEAGASFLLRVADGGVDCRVIESMKGEEIRV